MLKLIMLPTPVSFSTQGNSRKPYVLSKYSNESDFQAKRYAAKKNNMMNLIKKILEKFL